MDRDKLKLIVKNLKLLVDSLESEIYSDVTAYKYEGPTSITDYDEIFEDDDYSFENYYYEFLKIDDPATFTVLDPRTGSQAFPQRKAWSKP